MTVHLPSLLPVAERAVAVAAEIVRTRLPGAVTAKGDRDMATEVDYAVEQAVRDFLAEQTPEIGFLGEEEGAVAGADSGLTWVLDPVDGTVNLLHGVPLCGVSLGLVGGDLPRLGVIELPFLGLRYTAVEGGGARAGEAPIRVSGAGALSDAVVAVGDYAVGEGAEAANRPRLTLTGELAARVSRVRMLGSAAVDLAWVAEGRIDACVMLNNRPWDTAAGVLIAREAGAVVVDADGTPHTMGSRATIAAAPAVLRELLGLVARAGG
ncbi:inositol monophosphatase family protein [Planomonospora corallina]|uniref:Inositol-1-monophosphatase n=1 Tax=Planomonospora corallina TaxID=1806052 RepID=A0ABV8IJV4_9ACTN